MNRLKLNSYRLILIILVGLALVATTTIVILARFEEKLSQQRNEQTIKELELKIARAEFEIIRLRLTTGSGDQEKTIEILANGTITLTTKDGTSSAILGFSQLVQLFGSLTKEQIENLQASYLNCTGEKYTLTIETSDHQIAVVDLCLEDAALPPELLELILNIEQLAQTAFIPPPTPAPNPSPSPSPSGSSPAASSPSPTSSPPTPVPTSPPNGGAVSPPTPPDYLTVPPFTCEDFTFVRDTIISNVICVANQSSP